MNFMNSTLLNNRDTGVQSGQETLDVEQNGLQDSQVWRFINEKDYWLCQDYVVVELDVHIPRLSDHEWTLLFRNFFLFDGTIHGSYCGSFKITKYLITSNLELSPKINSRVYCCPNANQYSDLEVEVGSTVEETSPCCHTSIKPFICDSCCCKHVEETLPCCHISTKPFICDSCCKDMKPIKPQTPSQSIEFIFKLNQNISNSVTKLPQDTRIPPRRKLFQKSCATMTRRNNYSTATQKSSKLKVFVHKSVSTCSLTPTKAAKFSVPCNPSHLMVQIFEADPTLSDSCLIQMKRFKTSIQNACSCLNNILQQLNDKEIKESSLDCKIRASHIDLNLRRPGMPTFRVFLTRVPSDRNINRCSKSQASTETSDNSNTQKEKSSKNSEVLVDRDNQDRGRRVTFYSPCSNDSLLEDKPRPKKMVQFKDELEERTSTKKHNEGQLMWSKKEEKEVNFLLSPISMTQRNESSGTSCDEDGVKSIQRGGEESENQLLENSKGKGESSDSTSICSPDSLKMVSPRESVSKESCRPKQRTKQCPIKDALAVDEKAENVNLEKTNLVEKADGFSNFKENISSREITSEAKESSRLPISVQQGPSTVSQEKNLSGKERPILKSSSTLEERGDSTGLKITFKEEERSIPGTNETQREAKINIEKKKPPSEESEKFSLDSICTQNTDYSETDDAKCSCCGKDLSDSEEPNEPETLSTCRSIKSPSLEVIKTSTLIVSTDVDTQLADKTPSSLASKCKITSHITDNPISFHNQFARSARVDLSQTWKAYPAGKCSPNCACNLRNQNCYPERVLASSSKLRTEQLRSKVSTDLDSLSEDLHIGDNASITQRSPQKQSTLKSKLRQESFRVYKTPSSTNLQGDKASSETQCKSHFPRLSRYRNRVSSIVSNNLCNSSVNQIKHLLRKKLHRLLLEKDQGTCTSKTYLRSERYLISVSSGKLNESRIAREPCGLNRCPFTKKNGDRVVGHGETSSERKIASKKKDSLEDGVVERCRRMMKGEIFRRIRSVDVSRILGQKRTSKTTEWQRSAGEGECMRDKVGRKEEFYCNYGGRTDRRSSVTTFSSTKMLLVGDGKVSDKEMERSVYLDKVSYREKEYCNSRDKFGRESYSSSNWKPKKNSGKLKTCEGKNGTFSEDGTLGSHELRFFEKRLFELAEDESNDLANLLNSYEKCIKNLNVHFRLKLLQYVALCRSVKDSLVTRLRSDEVCNINSNSK
ncbi:uncharacterized protein LOC143177347 [Calliopsis andreniformis]|uniref:uncharacterized protein LOC143177347 n=1 Tax=Calliopsis andreniformis TaxID=337506 RepID=UPI003FCE44AF